MCRKTVAEQTLSYSAHLLIRWIGASGDSLGKVGKALQVLWICYDKAEKQIALTLQPFCADLKLSDCDNCF